MFMWHGLHLVGKADMFMWHGLHLGGNTDMFVWHGLHLDGNGAAVFVDELQRTIDSGMGSIKKWAAALRQWRIEHVP